MSYVYEPEWGDPPKELEISLNFYRHLVNRLHTYDDMEVIAYLPARDGIAWALAQLDSRVDQAILDEIEELDARLRENANYLVKELDVYGDIWRDEPEEYWWWYLDGGKPDPGGIPSAEERQRQMMMEAEQFERLTYTVERPVAVHVAEAEEEYSSEPPPEETKT